MANTLTNLIPTLYEAADIVSREMVGMIPAVYRDSSAEMAAKDQTINIPVVPAATAYDITPGTDPADNGDVTPTNVTMTIDKSRYSPVRWNGEEQKAVNHTGIYTRVHVDRIAQAMRTLTNEIETDLCTEAYNNTSGAYGTVATIPFTTNLAEAAFIRKTLIDRGAPKNDLQLVFDTTTGATLRSLTQLTKVNEAGDSSMLRRGELLDIAGMSLRESAQIQEHTAGTGSAYTSAATGYAVGTTSIPIITGTGTVLADDVISFAGDSNKYTVVTGVAAPGTIVIAEPGLLQALPASAQALTIVASHTANIAFDRNAIALITRAPEMPEGGDSASDVVSITDPVSGITFQAAMYKQYRQTKLEIGVAWGKKAIAPRHISRLYY
jgi:hypothetical protein